MPRPPDAGFFGRDETLLALDRAFDTQPVVLLHAFAGAGKTTTAAEFARWYAATGGLDHPAPRATGPVLWSSFEHHLPLDRLLDAAGDHFAALLEANGIHWQAITDPAQRRDLVLQVLAQVPVLWVWDNVEPVTGFPAGTPAPGPQASRTSSPGSCATWPSRPGARCCSPPAATSRPGWATCPPGSSCRRCRCANGCSWPRALAARHGHQIPAAPTGGRCCATPPATR